MASIKKLKDPTTGEMYYPVTSTQAVFTSNGESVEDLIGNLESVEVNPTIPDGTTAETFTGIKAGNTYYAPASGGGGALYRHNISFRQGFTSAYIQNYYCVIYSRQETTFTNLDLYNFVKDGNILFLEIVSLGTIPTKYWKTITYKSNFFSAEYVEVTENGNLYNSANLGNYAYKDWLFSNVTDTVIYMDNEVTS